MTVLLRLEETDSRHPMVSLLRTSWERRTNKHRLRPRTRQTRKVPHRTRLPLRHRPHTFRLPSKQRLQHSQEGRNAKYAHKHSPQRRRPRLFPSVEGTRTRQLVPQPHIRHRRQRRPSSPQFQDQARRPYSLSRRPIPLYLRTDLQRSPRLLPAPQRIRSKPQAHTPPHATPTRRRTIPSSSGRRHPRPRHPHRIQSRRQAPAQDKRLYAFLDTVQRHGRRIRHGRRNIHTAFLTHGRHRH
jgi:hypothetical protein